MLYRTPNSIHRKILDLGISQEPNTQDKALKKSPMKLYNIKLAEGKNFEEYKIKIINSRKTNVKVIIGTTINNVSLNTLLISLLILLISFISDKIGKIYALKVIKNIAK